jgi:hypothetical protein
MTKTGTGLSKPMIRTSCGRAVRIVDGFVHVFSPLVLWLLSLVLNAQSQLVARNFAQLRVSRYRPFVFPVDNPSGNFE